MVFNSITALLALATRFVRVQGQSLAPSYHHGEFFVDRPIAAQLASAVTSTGYLVCPTTSVQGYMPRGDCKHTVYGSTSTDLVGCGGCRTLVVETSYMARIGMVCTEHPVPTITMEDIATTVTSCEPSPSWPSDCPSC